MESFSAAARGETVTKGIVVRRFRSGEQMQVGEEAVMLYSWPAYLTRPMKPRQTLDPPLTRSHACGTTLFPRDEGRGRGDGSGTGAIRACETVGLGTRSGSRLNLTPACDGKGANDASQKVERVSGRTEGQVYEPHPFTGLYRHRGCGVHAHPWT